MNQFKLDSRLDNDCFILSESENFMVLLMNNSIVPWFILVPKTDKTELFQLEKEVQIQILQHINQLSQFVMDEFEPDKLNIAHIGNIVSQMHIHIVGRFKSDPYWPGVVWGASEKEPYSAIEVNNIKNKLNNVLVI